MPLEKYKLYDSEVIKNNYEMFINHTDTVYHKLTQELQTDDTTWSYNKYNIFSITATSHLYYDLFKELSFIIKDYIGQDLRIWIESWLNYHTYEKLNSLSWHSHDYLIHGYICIDPKNSVTEFKDFKIQNKIGQIYIGLGGPGMDHNVNALEPYDGYRSTIAFDCVIDANKVTNNTSFFPLI